jgi:BirA family biotin operon repressor/biotin-[acetyl-CoA-carboxylase] ligase
LFTFKDFDIKLDTELIGRNFIYCEEIDSTNGFLMDAKNNTDIDGTVVFAERQFHGKGRMDKKWYSTKEQNLTFSVLLKKKINEKNINIINLGAAVAIAISLENLFQLKVNLKWPNDVLVNGNKIAGILVESSIQGNKVDKLVVGIGLNVNQTLFQGNFSTPPTSIKIETGTEVNRELLFGEILNNFEEVLNRIYISPETVLDDWRARCRMIGEKIIIEEESNSKTGVFDDIDEQGFLVLRTDNNTFEKIHLGSVSLR